jgi:hypothetical protein
MVELVYAAVVMEQVVPLLIPAQPPHPSWEYQPVHTPLFAAFGLGNHHFP